MNVIKDKWKDVLELADSVIAPTYGRPPKLFVDGQGAILRDAEGEEFLDMTGGIAVLALGHCSEVVAEAIKEAADNLVHISNLYHSAPPVELAARLTENSFADSVFYCNSGAESVESAIKFARLFGGEDRREIVTFDGSFHGRTLGALAATDRPEYQKPFEPLPRGFKKLAWNDSSTLNEINTRTAAVLVEPIQGEQGIRVAKHEWMQALRTRCDEVGALLVFDEIQCGLGRTGQLWAHEEFRLTPDMMTLAKPLAGGLPIRAVLMTRAVSQKLKPGVHGTTFGGNPLIAHVAGRVFDTINQPTFLSAVKEKGNFLRHQLERLTSLPIVEEIRGTGLMLGIRLKGVSTKDVVDRAFAQKLLIVPSVEQVVRFLPPLNSTFAELELALERFKAVLEELDGRNRK